MPNEGQTEAVGAEDMDRSVIINAIEKDIIKYSSIPDLKPEDCTECLNNKGKQMIKFFTEGNNLDVESKLYYNIYKQAFNAVKYNSTYNPINKFTRFDDAIKITILNSMRVIKEGGGLEKNTNSVLKNIVSDISSALEPIIREYNSIVRCLKQKIESEENKKEQDAQTKRREYSELLVQKNIANLRDMKKERGIKGSLLKGQQNWTHEQWREYGKETANYPVSRANIPMDAWNHYDAGRDAALEKVAESVEIH
jgi:hypothetical protein